MHAIHSLLTGIKDELFCLTVNNQMAGWLVGFHRPFSAPIWYIRDERSEMESYPYPVTEG